MKDFNEAVYRNVCVEASLSHTVTCIKQQIRARCANQNNNNKYYCHRKHSAN